MKLHLHNNKSSKYYNQLEHMFVGEDDEYSPVGILLHGFGSSSQDVVSVASVLLEQVPFWIVPQGPIKLIDFLAHHAFAWFPDNPKHITEALLGALWKDVHTIDFPEMQTVANKIVGEIILPLRQINPIRPVVLAGFSQGGMMASEIIMHCMQFNIVIEKAMLFSTCTIAENRWHDTAYTYITEGKSSVKVPRIFQAHGTKDEIISLKNALRLKEFWQEYTTLEFMDFEGHHEIPQEVIEKASHFLQD